MEQSCRQPPAWGGTAAGYLALLAGWLENAGFLSRSVTCHLTPPSFLDDLRHLRTRDHYFITLLSSSTSPC